MTTELTATAAPDRRWITRQGSLKLDLGFCVVYTVLIVAGMYIKAASLAAFLLVALAFFCLPLENILGQMLYLMSFAMVFKISPTSTSFMTILEIFVVLLSIMRCPFALNVKKLILFVGLLISILLGIIFNSNSLQPLLIIKLFVALILVILFQRTDHKKEMGNYSVLFVSGLVGSSLFAYILQDTAAYQQYKIVVNIYYKTNMGYVVNNTQRFTGFNPDPNYFSVNVCIALVLLLLFCIFKKPKNNWLMWASVVSLVVFGFMTISKSFLLMIVLIYVYIWLVLALRHQYRALGIISALGVLLVVVLVFGKSTNLNLLLQRFEQDVELGNFSTGRFDIWKKHIAFWKEHPFRMLFGLGLDTTMLPHPHSFYVEIISDLGLIGSAFLLALIWDIIRPQQILKRRLENYTILFIILLMYGFLGMLTWFDLPFHLYLCYCMINSDLEPKHIIGGEYP